MPAGIEAFDAQGNVLISYTARINPQLGSIWTGGVGGSLNVPELATGTPWIATAPSAQIGVLNQLTCAVSVVGTTIVWSYPEGRPGTPIPTKILYGVRR